MPQRTYTQEQREEALRLYLEHGPAEAAERTGIPGGTIRSWAKRSGATDARPAHAREAINAARLTWAQRKAEMTVRLGEVAAGMLEKADGAKRGRDARSYSQATGTLIDKAQLLDGGATERHAISDDDAMAKVRELRERIEAGQRDEVAAKRSEKAA